MCLSALAMVIKANETSYLLMDIVIVEINKVILTLFSWLTDVKILGLDGCRKSAIMRVYTKH